MRSFADTIRAFARQLVSDFAKRYHRDPSEFRHRAGTLLTKSIPGSRPGPKLIQQTTDATKILERCKVRCQEQNLPFQPRDAWKEICRVLQIPDSERPRLRDRVRSRRYAERRRKSQIGIYTSKTHAGDIHFDNPPSSS